MFLFHLCPSRAACGHTIFTSLCSAMMLFSFPYVWCVNGANIATLSLTSCALNGPPLGTQDQSQTKNDNDIFRHIAPVPKISHPHGAEALTMQ